MYDRFSDDYDRFVDWPSRLAAEMPFFLQQLREAGARRVLDAACGTGMHALALAKQGYEVAGADLSAGMIARAQANAARLGLPARFVVAGFGHLAAEVGGGFDALLCLGNSLPHLLRPEDLAAALGDFHACLRPRGLLLIQNRNFDAVLAQQKRWMEPQVHQEGDREWLFLRFYDFLADGLLTFHVVRLERQGQGPWRQEVDSAPLWPQRQTELDWALERAGFGAVRAWGDIQGRPFDPQASPNLILAARRADAGHGDGRNTTRNG